MRVKFAVLAFILLTSSTSAAEDMFKSVADACMQSKNIQVCEDASETLKTAEKNINKTLDKYGLRTVGVLATSVAKTAIEGKFKIEGRGIPLIKADRSSVEIEGEQVMLKIEWAIN